MNDEIDDDLKKMDDEIGDLMGGGDDALGEDALGEETLGEDAGTETAIAAEEVSAEVEPGEGRDDYVNVDLIMDLPLQVVVELGRTKMLINDLLQIGQGSVIELNKQVGNFTFFALTNTFTQ